MRTVIIDDEPDASEALNIIISDYIPELEIVGIYNNPLKAREEINDIKPELVFLDINMPHMNGFEFLESLENIDFKIIFITAYDEYAIKAFKFSASDYILKPINIDELISSVKKVFESLSKMHAIEDVRLNKLTHFLKKERPSRIVISTYEGAYYLNPEDVVYIKADKNYSDVYLYNSKPIVVSRNLKELEDLLSPEDFFRSHHSYIVNLRYVHKFSRLDGGSIEMTNGEILPLSRRKKNEFADRMNQLGNI